MSDRDALHALRSVSDPSALHVFSNYLYFPNERAARQVAYALSTCGYSVEHRLGADQVNWLVLAKKLMCLNQAGIAEMRAFLEGVAENNGGEYDGWEAEVQDAA
jgi:hypothetical protein